MRNPKRIPVIIETLQDIWENKPDLRFGQLVYSLYKQNFGDRDIFFIEDDDFLTCLFKENGEI